MSQTESKPTEPQTPALPVCPYCNTQMRPTQFVHYYSDSGGTSVWMCNCDPFPSTVETERHREGY